jgi:hypothetical protein
MASRAEEPNMNFWTKLFSWFDGKKAKKDRVVQEDRKTGGIAALAPSSAKVLLFEGTQFPLFTEEDSFFESCRATGQGAFRTSVNFYKTTSKATKTSSDWIRLFMMPGMQHCQRGEAE